MLHKSFKPAKCKMALKLASSRIKLMKNKKGVQLNQMKRELVQLLESGQDQTARIRVEHVIREEKMIAAYDLVEIYCELIVARLPIIESQKNCPIDLKEAITSVIFASPRCADIPELLDVRKHFTAKYGKEFVSAAVELRPDCRVSSMLAEKLSAMAPDGQTKVKLLNAIAKEHNIKWEPKSFGERDSKPPDDLLNGPNTFEKASKMHVEPPKFQAPNVQAPPSPDQKHDKPLNFSKQNIRSSLGIQNFSSTDTGGINTTVSAASHPDVRPSGIGSERMKARQSFSGDGSAFSLGRQNWNMEFKDATSAAQAAAESAELASMAARAAAELSSQGKISRQYSTESQKSNIHGLRDEGRRTYFTSKVPDEHTPEDSTSNSFLDRNPKLQNEPIYRNEHENLEGAAERFSWDGRGSTERPSRSPSLRSRKASIDDDILVNTVRKTDEYSQKSSIEEEVVKAENCPSSSKLSTNKQSRESEVELVSGRQDGFKSTNNYYFEEERIRKQSTTSYSRSHSGTFGDDYNVSNSNHQRFGNDDAVDLFVGSDQGSIYRDTLVNSVQKMDEYSRKSSFEEDAVIAEKGSFSSKMSMKKEYRESKVEFVSGRQDSFKSANIDYFEEGRIRKLSTTSSSHSHSSNFGDDYEVSNSNHQKFGNDAAEDLYVGIDQGSIYREAIKTSTYDDEFAAFDGSGSDNDSYRFDIGPKYDKGESESYFAPPGRESPTHPSTNTESWSPIRNMSISQEKSTSQLHFSAEWHFSPIFSESSAKSMDFSQPDNSLPVTFDDSDALNSESEDELEKSRLSRTKDSRIRPRKQNVYSINPDRKQSERHGLTGPSFAEKVNSGSDKRPWLRSSSDDLDSMEVRPNNNQGTDINVDSTKKFHLGESLASQPSTRLGKSRLELNDLDSESSLYNRVDEVNHLPSLQSSMLSSVYEAKNNVRTPQSFDTLKDNELLNQSSSESGEELNFGTLRGGLRNKGYGRPPYTRSPSGETLSSSKKADEESSTTIAQTAATSVGRSFNSTVSRNVDKKSSSLAPITRSNSDTDDLREEFPQETLSRRPEPYAQKASQEVDTKFSFRAPVTYSTTIAQTAPTSVGSSFNSRVSRNVDKKSSSFAPITRSDSGANDSREEFPQQTLSRRPEPFAQKASQEVDTKSSFRAPVTYSTTVAQTAPTRVGTSFNSRVSRNIDKKSSFFAPITRSDSGTDDSREEFPQQSLSRRPEPYVQKASKEVNSKSILRAPVTYFDPDNIDSEEDLLNQTSNNRDRSGSVFSQRTTAVSSNSETATYSKVRVSSEASVNPKSGPETKPISSSYGAETPPMPRFQTGTPSQWRSREQPSSAKPAASKPMPEPKTPSREGSLKSSAVEQSSSALRMTLTSGRTENNPKTSNLSANTDKKASHVHPKLPDYDTIAAHFLSLRKNRQ